MEFTDYLRFVAALAVVLGLIGVIAWAARRYGLGQGGRIGRAGGAERRLAVVEALAVDNRRRLVLIRRDGVHHLLLLGVGQDVVIEAGIPAKPSSPSVNPP